MDLIHPNGSFKGTLNALLRFTGWFVISHNFCYYPSNNVLHITLASYLTTSFFLSKSAQGDRFQYIVSLVLRMRFNFDISSSIFAPQVIMDLIRTHQYNLLISYYEYNFFGFLVNHIAVRLIDSEKLINQLAKLRGINLFSLTSDVVIRIFHQSRQNENFTYQF